MIRWWKTSGSLTELTLTDTLIRFIISLYIIKDRIIVYRGVNNTMIKMIKKYNKRIYPMILKVKPFYTIINKNYSIKNKKIIIFMILIKEPIVYKQ